MDDHVKQSDESQTVQTATTHAGTETRAESILERNARYGTLSVVGR